MGGSLFSCCKARALDVPEVRIANASDSSLHLWFDGGGPIARLPEGAHVVLSMPKHVLDHRTVQWSVTTSDAIAMPVASGSFANPAMANFRPRKGSIVDIQVPSVGVSQLRRVIAMQRRIRTRMRAAEQRRRQGRAERQRSSAVRIQAYARGSFARTTRQCSVCADDMPAPSLVAVAADCRDASHRICAPCARRYIDQSVADGKLFIKCPGIKCRHLAQPGTIEGHGSAAMRTMYREALAASHGQRLAAEEDGDFLGFARKHTRICPACSVLIYRYEGCNHMTCRCGFEFQWDAKEAQVAAAPAAPAAVMARVWRESAAAGPTAVQAALRNLHFAALAPFDGANVGHVAVRKRLWVAAFGEGASGVLAASPRWKALGFQGVDPRTDLRAAGVMGLHHLLAHVSSDQPPAVGGAGNNSMWPSAPGGASDGSSSAGGGAGGGAAGGAAGGTDGAGRDVTRAFPLALASISCTALLQSYLGMNPNVVRPDGTTAADGGIAPTAVLVRLLQFAGAEQPQTGELVAWEMRTLGQPMLCRSDAYVLQALHARWLRHLYELWVVRRNSRPETTLME